MNIFGLDIGTTGLRLIQLRKEGTGYRLLSIASSDFSGRGLLSEADKDHRDLAEVIKKMVFESKVNTNQVVVGLPEAMVFSRLIKVPVMTDEELSSSINWEAEQYVPVPLSEVNLDWEIVSRQALGEKKMEVFLVAAPSNLIEKYTKILKLASLTPVAVETEAVALARCLVGKTIKTALLVDFGASMTDLLVTKQEKIVLTRSVPTGGQAFTRALRGELGIEEAQAEEYKRKYGLGEEIEGKIKKTLDPFLNILVEEIKKTIDFYQAEQKEDQLNLIILTGGSAKLPGVSSFLTSALAMEVQIADPFATLVKDQFVQKFLADGPFFSVAMGLAMKEV